MKQADFADWKPMHEAPRDRIIQAVDHDGGDVVKTWYEPRRVEHPTPSGPGMQVHWWCYDDAGNPQPFVPALWREDTE